MACRAPKQLNSSKAATTHAQALSRGIFQLEALNELARCGNWMMQRCIVDTDD